MKKIVNIKFIIILSICFCFTIIEGINIFKANEPVNKQLDTKVLSYISKNIENYNKQNEMICKLVSEEESELKSSYLKFNVDNTTIVQFYIDSGSVYIKKDTKYKNEKATVKMWLKNLYTNIVYVRIDYETGGTWCEYKINDFENPIPDDGEYEQAHYIIMQSIKPEELKDLCLKAHSIYDKLEEIYKKNNL